MAFSIYSKKDYQVKQNSIGNHNSFDFGNKILVEFHKFSHGTYPELETAIQVLMREFFEQQLKLLDKNITWATERFSENIISQENLTMLEKKSENFKKNLIHTSLNANKIYPQILELVKKRLYVINLFELFNKSIFDDYRQYLNNLYKISNEKYELAEDIKSYLNKEQSHFKENKRKYLKLFQKDKKIYHDTLKEINLFLRKCRYPGKLSSKEFLEDFEILKENHRFLRNKLSKFENELYEQQQEFERKKNLSDTGYYETDQERVKRVNIEDQEKKLLEEKFRNKKIKFQKYQEKLGELENILEYEIKVVYPEKYNKITKELNELKNISFENYTLNTPNKENHLIKILTKIDELKIEINKPNEKITKFLNDSTKNVLIIEGMAGTGKTSKIIHILTDHLNQKTNNNSNNTLICAPSTVGAANIRQRLKIRTFTFQSIIKPGQIFKHKLTNSDNELKIFIVDEANMLTENQLKALFYFFRKNKDMKYIFIGDRGQINAYDYNSSYSEESPALSVETLLEIGKYQKNQIEYLFLNIEYRFNKFENKNDFITVLKWLRSEYIEPPIFINFKNKLSRLPLKMFEEVKGKNKIIELFNRNLSIGDYISSRLDSGQVINIDRLIKKFELPYTAQEIENAVEIYQNPINRRPELGKIYSTIFPNVKKRVNNPEEVDSSIILRRSNEGVLETNKSVRPYLFEENKVVLNQIEIGELLFVNKAPKYIKELTFKTNIEEGDIVVVTKIDKTQPLIESNILKVKVKPVLKKTDTWLQLKFKQIDDILKHFNLAIDFFTERSILIWTGNLNKIDDFFEWNNYINHLRSTDINNDSPYLVTYGYAKTIFTAQGGEWENVFIHEGDIWGYNLKEEKKYLYTAATRATKKIWFTN